MKPFKEIFGRIWALWMLIVFTGTMLIFLIPFFLFIYFKKDPFKTLRFISWSRRWMGTFLTLSGCPLTITGRQHFVHGRSYIVLCNHNSFMDIPVSSPSIPGGNKTIAKAELAKIPLFGTIYRTGSVLVDRRSDSSRKESFHKMKKVLDMGLHMCIYPEGTRNRTMQPLKDFHSGAFRLAVDTGTQIIPAVIFNTRKVLPADKIFYALPHRLSIHFLPPVAVESTDTVDSLRRRVHAIMEQYYSAHSR